MNTQQPIRDRRAPTTTEYRELAAFPARLLSELPVRTRLHIYLPGIPKDIAFISHELAEPREVVDQILFDGLELRAIIEAASCDRLWPTDFLQLCIRKWDDPGMRVDRDIAMQGAHGQPAVAAELSVAELLRRLGATLIGLELETSAAASVELAA